MVHGTSSINQSWTDRIRRFERSGLSMAGFCRSENISATQFYYWRKRLAKLASASPSGSHVGRQPSISGTRASNGSIRRTGKFPSEMAVTPVADPHAVEPSSVHFTIHTDRARIDCQCSSLQAIDLLLSWATRQPQSGFQQLNISRQ